jgi:hypothetical protein
LANRAAVYLALTFSFVTLSPRQICAQTAVEVYPGPGVDTYKSNLYRVEVFDGSNWLPSYVYKFSRKSVTPWWLGSSPSVNFTTFGTSAPIEVRITRLAGPITGIDASPKSKPRPGKVKDGVATGTLDPNDKFWLTINGDDANPLFIFADPLKPPVPAGATHFGPGITQIAPATGNHYKATSNEVIYLDGGAWVQGTIDLRGTSNVQIIGPGVLSGDLWKGENINPLPYDEFTDYAMIRGDWFGGNGARVSGLTIVDTPGNAFFSGADHVSGVKILSPWFYGTDAFQAVSHIDHTFCFNGDEVFTPGWAGVQGQNITYTSSFVGTTNNAVFAGGYWGNSASDTFTSLAEDIDIRTYNTDQSGPPILAAAFQIWLDNSDSTKGYANQTYRNIRIEAGAFGTGALSVPLLELKNVVYWWGGPTAVNPPLGNGHNLVFQDITFNGAQKYRSEIKGWDASNGFHNVVLDNVVFSGTVVTPANIHQFFDINNYVWDLGFTAPAPPPCGSDADIAPPDTPDSGRGSIVPIDRPCAVPIEGVRGRP